MTGSHVLEPIRGDGARNRGPLVSDSGIMTRNLAPRNLQCYPAIVSVSASLRCLRSFAGKMYMS